MLTTAESYLQLNFNPALRNLTYSTKMFKHPDLDVSFSREIEPGAKARRIENNNLAPIKNCFQVGRANGLTLLLDAETYEYSSHAAGAEGFKVAVEHHLDQPLMSISELDITPGFESQGRDCNSDQHA